MSCPPAPAEYSIAAVSKLTGVSCHALRVWERRYGFPRPQRSASNQRRYSAEQVERLRAIVAMTRAGQSIGELIAEWKEPLASPVSAPIPDPEAVSGEVSSLIDALCRGDQEEADAILDLVFRRDSTEAVLRLLEPVLTEIGERWFRKSIDVFQEHYATGVVLRALGRNFDEARRRNEGPNRHVIVAAIQGERHEGGLAILGTALELAGWRVRMLGADLPVDELAKAVDLWKPDAVGISFVLSRSVTKRFGELATIRTVPVFVGGRSVTNHQGLARRHGLIPIVGPISTAVAHWSREFDHWHRGRSNPS